MKAINWNIVESSLNQYCPALHTHTHTHANILQYYIPTTTIQCSNNEVNDIIRNHSIFRKQPTYLSASVLSLLLIWYWFVYFLSETEINMLYFWFISLYHVYCNLVMRNEDICHRDFLNKEHYMYVLIIVWDKI